MRVLCVGAAVLFMVCPSPVRSQSEQGEELQFTAELPAGVPDSTEWMGTAMMLTMNIPNPVGERLKGDPVAAWMIDQGICSKDGTACEFRMYADASGRFDEETHAVEYAVRVVVRNESGKLAECLGYWAGTDNIVQRQSFWFRSGGKWQKRNEKTRSGMDDLRQSDVFFSLRVAAILKELQTVKPE